MKFAKHRAKFCFHLQIVTVLFLSIQAAAQTSTTKPLAEIDLKPLGVRAPESGFVSATAIELLFISDNHLVLLEENDRLGEPRDAHLMRYEIGTVTPYLTKTLSLGEDVLPISAGLGHSTKVLEWLDPLHFAYRNGAGRWLCDTDLNCGEEKERETTPVTHSQSGDCSSSNLMGLIDTQMAVCLMPRVKTKWSAVVLDSSGRHLYVVEQGKLPWDASLVSSIQGQRFGLEWKSNTVMQLLDPLACIDECPPAGREHFAIFDSSDGRKLQDFEWDPRPFNLYVLPALSPSGKTAAFVRADKLVLYSLDSLASSTSASM